jgi:hypothetical protein
MADMKIFEQAYQANFGHSLKSTRDVWYDFVKDCDELALKNAMDTLEEVYQSKKGGGYRAEPPTLGEVKREYWKQRNQSSGADKKRFCNEGCVECGGTGSVVVVVNRTNGRIMNPQTPEAYAYGQLAYTNVGCPYGFYSKRRDHRGFGPAHDMPLQLAYEYMVRCDKMAKRQEAER